MSTVRGDDRLKEETTSESAAPSEPKAPKTRQRSSRPGQSAGGARKSRAATQAAKETQPAEGAVATGEPSRPPKPRLLEMFHSEVVPTIMQEFKYGNVMQVPRLKKVVLNIGLGEALTNPKAMDSATKDLTTISGQKPIVTRARRSIAGFKLREGNPIGLSVTLRGNRMYDFLDRLLNTALPRIRDFRGVSPKSFDGRGNYSLGIREQIIFPEIDYGQIERIRGFQVTITTTARTDGEATRLLSLLGMPFSREN